MAIELGAFLNKKTKIKKESIHIKFLKKFHIKVSKKPSELNTEFKKKALKSLKEEFVAAASNPEMPDPKGTRFKIVVFKSFTTDSKTDPEDIYLVLTDKDLDSMKTNMTKIKSEFLNQSSKRLYFMDAVYVGKAGGKHYIELEKGDTKVSIADQLTPLNSLATELRMRFVQKGKAPKTENTSEAATVINSINKGKELSDFVATFEASYTKFTEKAATITKDNAKQSIMFLEMPLKKMQKTFKQILAKKPSQEVVDELMPKFNECKKRFIEVKKMTVNINPAIELAGKIRALGVDVSTVKKTNYQLNDVLGLSASLQAIGATPTYKSLLKNEEKLKKNYKQLRLVIHTMVNNTEVKMRLLKILNDTDTFFEDYNDNVKKLWKEFGKTVKKIESFKLISTDGLAKIRTRADVQMTELRDKARGLLQAAKFVSNIELTEVQVSERMATMRASLRQLKTALDEKLDYLEKLSKKMADQEESMIDLHKDTSIDPKRKDTMLRTSMRKLEVDVAEFNSAIDSQDTQTAAA